MFYLFFLSYFLFAQPCIHPSTYLSIHLFTCLVIHSLIHSSMDTSICPWIRPSIRPSVRPSVHPSTHLSKSSSAHIIVIYEAPTICLDLCYIERTKLIPWLRHGMTGKSTSISHTSCDKFYFYFEEQP